MEREAGPPAGISLAAAAANADVAIDAETAAARFELEAFVVSKLLARCDAADVTAALAAAALAAVAARGAGTAQRVMEGTRAENGEADDDAATIASM